MKLDGVIAIVTGASHNKGIGTAICRQLAKTSYNVQMVEAPEINLSSTFIRNRLHRKGSLQFLLPPAVETYIRKEGLYGATNAARGH